MTFLHRFASIASWIVVPAALVGAIAGWIPANRASRLDPTRVLTDI